MVNNRNNDQESQPNIYKCSQCSSKFKQCFNLTKHIKSVYTQEEFQCDQCASSLQEWMI